MTSGASRQLTTGTFTRTRLQAGPHELAAVQTGPVDGPPVLLVPGYTGSKEDFAPVLGPFGDAGYRVTAIDLPGQYESPRAARDESYTPDVQGRVVVDAARALGTSVHLLGHSYGGLVARGAVLADASRFTSLTLLCSGPGALGGPRRRSIELLQPVLAAHGLPAVYAAMLAADRADPGWVAPPADLAAFLERRFLAGSREMLQGIAGVLFDEPDRVDELRAADVRTLVVHGVDDASWTPAAQRDMAERLGATYVVLPDSAHSPAVENPDALVACLRRFWGQSPTGSRADGSDISCS